MCAPRWGGAEGQNAQGGAPGSEEVGVMPGFWPVVGAERARGNSRLGSCGHPTPGELSSPLGPGPSAPERASLAFPAASPRLGLEKVLGTRALEALGQQGGLFSPHPYRSCHSCPGSFAGSDWSCPPRTRCPPKGVCLHRASLARLSLPGLQEA